MKKPLLLGAIILGAVAAWLFMKGEKPPLTPENAVITAGELTDQDEVR